MRIRYTLRARADLAEIRSYLVYYEIVGEEVRIPHVRHARRQPWQRER